MVCYFPPRLSQPFYLSAERIVLPSFFSLSQVVFAPERFAIECFVSGLSGFVALQEGDDLSGRRGSCETGALGEHHRHRGGPSPRALRQAGPGPGPEHRGV